MIPVLFDKSATDFSTYGIGALSDTISCVVTEERNGAFELEMEYPVTGIHYSDIQNSAIILAKPNESQTPQAFRIYFISNPINGIVTINAEHISYQLNFIPIGPITGTSCADVMSKIKAASLITNPFNFTTDKNVSTVFTTGDPRSVRALLGGQQGSILQQYQGEYLWNNWNVSLLTHRGADNGVVLRYGKNITDFTKEEDLSNTVTGILPFWKDESHLIIGDISEVNPSDLAFRRIETLDVSSELEATTTEEGTVVYPTKAQVTAEGLKALNNKSYIAVPSVNMKISFVALWQTEEYKDIAPLEHVNLCDTITVVYEQLGVQTQSKVIKTVYDVLLERYNEIEIGDSNASLVTNITAVNEAISDSMSRIEKLDDKIVLEVTQRKAGEEVLSSKIEALPGRLVLGVSNGTLAADTQASITLSVYDEEGQLIPIGEPGIITLDGTVVFKSNLSDGVTTISGSNITTGTINADNVTIINLEADNIKGQLINGVDINTKPEATPGYVNFNRWIEMDGGLLKLYSEGLLGGTIKGGEQRRLNGHKGIIFETSYELWKYDGSTFYLIPNITQKWNTNSSITASWKDNNKWSFRFTNSEDTGDASTTTDGCTVSGAQFLIDMSGGSDYHAKENIHDLDEKYIEVYEALKPKTFKFKDIIPVKGGTEASGLIAQQVQKACTDIGVIDIFSQKMNYQIPGYLGDMYSLDYNAFHAMHIQYAHHLKNRVDELENKNAELEARIAKLEEMIK